MKILIVNKFLLITGLALLLYSCSPNSDTPFSDPTDSGSNDSSDENFPVADAVDMGAENG